MLLVIDNYDSFTYNLVQYLGELGQMVHVIKNDELTLDEISEMNPERIVISPGPCTPNEAGVSVDVVKNLGKKIPILGICLGHQSIGQAFGGDIIRAPQIMHGKVSSVFHDGSLLFDQISNPFDATRYHSLVIDPKTIPECLEVTAWTHDDVIMGIEHKDWPIYGLQFHPESILTKVGHDLLNNFIKGTS